MHWSGRTRLIVFCVLLAILAIARVLLHVSRGH